MEKSLQISPHSLALVLSRVSRDYEQESSSSSSSSSPKAVLSVNLQQYHSYTTGYEVFANFKAVNVQHFWNKALTHALSEIFFLGWIDEHVLLIQGKEVHLQVLRNGWTRRTLKPPQGFNIKCIGGYNVCLGDSTRSSSTWMCFEITEKNHLILNGSLSIDSHHNVGIGDTVLMLVILR
ncbi:hypothetical protein JOB18_041363 [Solea senegalensis]|uniref:Uncharacterized protein n=1 Tax=Solea senegalensis TaxID=28829 RepID=A0AAV6QB37_SOLSE|nr:hypothetical protein JOB18_041363 [Solea senegalensis]